MKDSSRILPGHGGILDRLDSMFFVLPVSYLLVEWLITWAPR
jgi:phosphatidate cytidylyltransferase